MAGGKRPVALVTGARRGIGAATCIALAAGGYDILAVDKELEGARETGRAVVEAGGDFDFRFCDLADPGALAPLADWAWAMGGGVEAVVSNAGIGTQQRGDPLDLTPESWDQVMAVNTRAPFFLTQSLARRMVAEDAPLRGPRGIVFITSANAVLASPDRADYCASKAALSMLARCFALRLAEAGIPVFELRPGVIRTAMTAPVAERYTQRIADGLSPLRRWGEAEDVARAVAGLLSGAIPFSTGDAFHVDGGLHIGRL
ncbi:3-ketoacyl-ACP reductase [Belnapia rosea]|uniref:3-ketoacyl-ACP reductase n=1 Tax=Belnapia rosea TaxID=938405 RepID=UPI000892043B|nr:3-ketoacyl-ACP reductase [Belnapia rosea]SDB16244.1 NAD(P)-dependent dehydrogenase, short-chain alcohol dehydrogenase family [Belnapia rosea]